MSTYKKILFTGSSGRFGSKFKLLFNSKKYIYTKRNEFDITNPRSIEKYIKNHKPTMIVHCAALSRPMEIHDSHISKSISTNIDNISIIPIFLIIIFIIRNIIIFF